MCRAARLRPFDTVAGRDYFECQRCLAVLLDPSQLPTRAQERAHYDLHQNEVSDPRYREFLSRLAQPLLARLSPGSHGLDYGCGPGPALAAMLREAGHSVALYDPEYAADPGALEQRYDFITCSEVVEHFHRPGDEFERLVGLLRGGGWLAIMTAFRPTDRDFGSWYYRRDPTHVVFYQAATFRVLAGDHGLGCVLAEGDVALLRKVRRP